MTRQDIIDYCLTFPAAYEDYPFAALPGEDNTTVMRHKANKKSFALIMNHGGKLYLNRIVALTIALQLIEREAGKQAGDTVRVTIEERS